MLLQLQILALCTLFITTSRGSYFPGKKKKYEFEMIPCVIILGLNLKIIFRSLTKILFTETEWHQNISIWCSPLVKICGLLDLTLNVKDVTLHCSNFRALIHVMWLIFLFLQIVFILLPSPSTSPPYTYLFTSKQVIYYIDLPLTKGWWPSNLYFPSYYCALINFWLYASNLLTYVLTCLAITI